MKIKVVDMPYEQALAQPREKHMPPRRPSAACSIVPCAVAEQPSNSRSPLRHRFPPASRRHTSCGARRRPLELNQPEARRCR